VNIWYATLIRPAQGQQQASFRVPGDLAREDNLCKKIAPTELVPKINPQKYTGGYLKHILAI